MYDMPEKEQWQKLFPLAEKTLAAKPWQKYPEEMIFCFHLDGREDPLYLTVHGFEEETLGVSVYGGDEEIGKYLTILSQGDDISFQTIIANQSSSTVIFAEKEYLSPADEAAMDDADYVPEGEHSCILFRRNSPGFAPWFITKDDADLLVLGLNAFLASEAGIAETPTDPLKEMIDIDLTVSSPRISLKTIDPLLLSDREDVVKDDFFVAKLKQIKRTGKAVEIDFCYLNNPVGSQLGPIPFYPKLCVIADLDEGYIADQCIFEETSDEEESFFELIKKYFEENGLPRKIEIRRENTGYLLHDLCKRLKIQLEEKKELFLIDDFLKMIGG